MKARIMSWLLIAVVLIGAIFPANAVFSEESVSVTDAVYSEDGGEGAQLMALSGVDKTSVLTNKKATMNNEEIKEIKYNEDLNVRVSFDVPVMGDADEPENRIQHGDTASFSLSKGFSLMIGNSIELKTELGELIGHATLTTNQDTKEVTADVVFDGDPRVFNDPGTSGIKAWFQASLRYDTTGDAGEVGNHEVWILEKSYAVVVPPAKIDYVVTKKGEQDPSNTQNIVWTVNVAATQAGEPVDLEGYSIEDVLTGVGEYVPSSFTGGGSGQLNYDSDEKKLTYIFPPGSKEKQEISFKTKLSDDVYYSSTNTPITNTVQLLDKDQQEIENAKAEDTIYHQPEWISKSGLAQDGWKEDTTYDPTDRTITWTITANQMKADLESLTIVDQLPDGLIFQSANWNGTTISTEPSDGEYVLEGGTSNEVTLTIISKVKDDESGVTTGKSTFTNRAELRAKVKDTDININRSIYSNSVEIGYNALEKSGVAKSDRKVTWTVKADAKKQTPNGMTIYDLLIYENSGFDIAKASFDSTIENIDRIKENIKPSYNQKYVDNSFSSNVPSGNGYLEKVISVMQDGKRVGDLLVVTDEVKGNPISYTYDSLVLNPDIYAGDSETVQNSAALFTGSKYLNSATGTVDYKSNMLAKEMLHRDAQDNPAAGVNSLRTSNAAEGFDYVDKSIIFRLSVNADALDFDKVVNAAGDSLGVATLTDTLPEGWEFVEFGHEQPYLVFEGEKGSGASVNAKDTASDTVSAITGSIAGRTATFILNSLDQPYVILVKAKPNEATATGYFDDNRTEKLGNAVRRNNTVTLTAVGWTSGLSREQSFSIQSKLLDKSSVLPEEGVLNWTVDYNPYNLKHKGNKIEDTLSLGMDLRTDAKGQLLIDGNITAQEMGLKNDGSLEAGASVELNLGQNVSYDSATRTLTFTIPDSSKAYRFTYITDITGETGTIKNEVRLSGEGVNMNRLMVPYVIKDTDGGASLQRSGWLEVTKTDGTTGDPLAGAEFTLFSEDESTIIRKAVSGADGKLKLKVIPDGTYVLKETVAPAGYTISNVKYGVVVNTPAGGKPVTSIDGKPGDDSNKLMVVNLKTDTVGNLEISKTVSGTDGDKSKKFEFTINLPGISDSFDYNLIAADKNVTSGKIKDGDKVELAHNEKILIIGLPKGGKYVVSEVADSAVGYITSIDSPASSNITDRTVTGTIEADKTQLVTFMNTKDKPGSLVVSKTVTGNVGDQKKEFEFTITFNATGTFNYTGAGGAANGTISSRDKISLAHGQSISISGLPKGTSYEVTEADYAGDGYVSSSKNSKGIIGTDRSQVAAFTNTSNSLNGIVGNLEIGKTVGGTAGDKSKRFEFTINLPGIRGSYDYNLIATDKNVISGKITDGDTVELAHDEKILITGLPKDAGYTVTEADYSSEGYSTASTNDAGTIAADTTQSVVFTNTKDKPGSLVISKTVNGNAGDRNKEFDFTITFDATGTFNYTGAGGATDGTISSGDTISLAHGQSISISGLPKGTTYTVIEADYATDGYATTSTGDKGAIVTDDVQTAAFTNTRNVFVPGPGPGPSPGPSQPVVPSNPDKEDEDKPEVEEPKTEQPESEQPSSENSDPVDNGGNDDGGAVNNETVTDDENSGNQDGNVLGESDAVHGGTPKTGDTSFKQMAQFGLIFFLLALAGLFWADSVLRKRRTNSN